MNQNRGVVLGLDKGPGESEKLRVMDGAISFVQQPSYTKKTAERNLKALTSCSEKLLRALTDALFTVPHDKHTHLKVFLLILMPSITSFENYHFPAFLLFIFMNLILIFFKLNLMLLISNIKETYKMN